MGHLFTNADDESFLGTLELERFELLEIAGAGEGKWSDAIYARYGAPQKRQSVGESDRSDWLSTQRQEYGVEPDDEEVE